MCDSVCLLYLLTYLLPTKDIDLSNYLEEATPADAKAKEAQAAKEAKA